MPEPTIEDLRAELRTRAADVSVPAPPFDAVGDALAAGRRRRWAIVAGAALAAAAIAVGFLVIDTGDPKALPDPAQPTRTGSPLRVGDLPLGDDPSMAYVS